MADTLTLAALPQAGAQPEAGAVGAADAAKKGLTKAQREAAAERVGSEFEALYLSFMLSNMFTGIEGDGPLSGGQEEKMYRTHLYDEMGKILARSGGVGVADAVKREMLRQQETGTQ